MAAYLSPVFGAGTQLFTNQGIVLAGGLVYTYQAGTTVPVATWTDSTQAVSNANPIVLDSAGRFPQEVWLTQGQPVKFVVRDSLGSLIGTLDNISGVNDVSNPAISEWVATGLTPSYISPTSFSVAGNNTATFTQSRRVRIAVTGGTVYGYVVSSTFNGSITTVVIGVDSISLDAGISAVSVGLLNSVNLSVPQQFLIMSPAVTVASAATTPIGAAPSVNVIISGTTTITAFDVVADGIFRLVVFSGSLTITPGASLFLPGNVNIVTTQGDSAIFRSGGAGVWKCISWTFGGGAPTAFPQGTRMVFQQSTLPSGWTKDLAAFNDSCLRVVTSGVVGTGGTSPISAASTGAYTLQIADIPSHTHPSAAASSGFNTLGGGAVNAPFYGGPTGATGGGGSHVHPLAIQFTDVYIGVRQ